MASWQQKVDLLKQGGASDEQIYDEEQRRRKMLFDGGASSSDIDAYFGVPQFDNTALKDHFQQNFDTYKAATAGKTGVPKQAESFVEALEAGWQMSVTGLIGRGGAPDVELGKNAGMGYRIASQLGTLAGDLPAMFGGGLAGGAAGGAVGSPGGPVALATAAIGAGAGSFALPTAMRKILMDHYEKGDVKSFSDFWERASATFIEASKSAVIGGATAGVGGTVAKLGAPVLGEAGAVLSKPLLGAGTTAAAKTMAEIGTMVTVGSALEGEMPEPVHFLEAAIVVGGLHGTTKIASTLRKVYADTGSVPSKVVAESDTNPALKEQIVSEHADTAKINESMTGEKAPTEAERAQQTTKLVEEEVPKALPEPKVEAANPDEAMKRMSQNIGEREAKVKKAYSFNQFYTDFVDKLNPIKEAVKLLVDDPKALLDRDNPYSLARMVNDAKAKVKYIFEKGAIDFNTLGKVEGIKSFKEIIDQHKDNLNEFNAFLVSQRGLELAKRIGEDGRPAIQNIFSTDLAKEAQARVDAKAIVKKYGPKYAKAAQELVELQNANLKYLLDAQRISPEQYDAMVSANQHYIPFKRLLDQQLDGAGKKQGKGFLKNLTGVSEGAEKISNPLISVLDNTETVIKLAEQNRAVLSLVKMAESSEGQTLLEKVDTVMKMTEVSKEEMMKYFEKHNIEATPEAMKVFRANQKYNLAENEFEVFREGKREVWKATDPEIAKALNSLGGDTTAQNIFFKMASAVTYVKKLGISFTPEFIARNFMRDQLTAQVFSKMGGWRLPVIDTIVAMGDILKKNEHYYNFLKSGGAGGAFFETETLLNRNMFELNKQTGFIDAGRNLVSKPGHFLEAAARLTEEATRLAEHKRVAAGATEGAKLFEAGMAAREVTVDFQRIGAKMSAFNSITAFQNVSIQGFDRTIRAIKDNPKGMIAGASLITGVSTTLWAVNHDEKWYQELPRWEKDVYWHIEAGGVVYRFPKPQELGVMFGSLPERVLESFFSAPSMTEPMKAKALKDFGETVFGLVTPSFMPDALGTPIEQLTNYNFFTGQAVVPQRVEKLLPEYQSMEYTSETAKALGKLVGYVPGVRDVGGKDTKLASPMVIEHYVKGWSGTLGTYILQLADKAQEASKVARKFQSGEQGAQQGFEDLFSAALADVPVIKAFVSRYPNASTQSIKDFRERYQETERVFTTIKYLEKSGQADEMKEVMDRHAGDMIKLSQMNETISKMGQYIQLVNQTGSYSKSDKRQLIDSVYNQMIDVARSGNEMIEAFDKTNREAKKRSRLIP